jgi:outer membrane lipoprotein-sorting protein
MRKMMSLIALGVASTVVVTVGSASEQPAEALPAVLKETIAYYSTLTSYADTGTVRQEVPGIVDDSKFTTYFRRPTRDLYFDYQDLTSTNPANKYTIDMKAYRTVIWMVKGQMETYDFKMQAHDIIQADGGGQVRALSGANHRTRGTSILIPSLLYSKAGLPGTILQIEQAVVAGTEDVNRRRCHKIVGVAALYYPSGQRTGVRPVTVWIDAESRLIHRVFEDTPKSHRAGSYSRLTVTFDPRANPTIDDARFQFNVPSS